MFEAVLAEWKSGIIQDKKSQKFSKFTFIDFFLFSNFVCIYLSKKKNLFYRSKIYSLKKCKNLSKLTFVDFFFRILHAYDCKKYLPYYESKI